MKWRTFTGRTKRTKKIKGVPTAYQCQGRQHSDGARDGENDEREEPNGSTTLSHGRWMAKEVQKWGFVHTSMRSTMVAAMWRTDDGGAIIDA